MAISSPVRAEALGHQARVTAGAEGAVDRDLARARVEELQQLGGQDGDVVEGHLTQHGPGRR